MRVSVNWLREYVEFDETPAELSTRLTMAGLEVEQIETEGDEAVLEVKVTPNRGDCLSMIGIAREVSAFSGKPLKLPAFSLEEDEPPAQELVSVEIDAPDLCPRYSARVMTDLKIGPSPEWMQRRLTEAGMRPINNVVDATNYVMLETGQPLHAFDYDLVAGHKIIVRRAGEGEEFATLDGVEHTLTPDVLVIADAERAVAIAGVMGGSNSEVHDGTTRLLLESAHFEPIGNRRSHKIVGMSTEASYRFERHVDPEGTVCAVDRVAQLIQQMSGAKVARGVVDVYPVKRHPVSVALRPQRCNMMLDTELSMEQMAEMLGRLGFRVAIGEQMQVDAPSWRPDVTREIDLIEEIGRLYGYNNIPTTFPVVEIMSGRDSLYGETADKVRDILVGYGLDEVMTHSLTSPRSQEIMTGAVQPIVIRSPLSIDLSVLRTSLIPNLLAVAQRNTAAGVDIVRVFEIGSVFGRTEGDEIYEEWKSLCGLMMGAIEPAGWRAAEKPKSMDFFHMKGIVESLLKELGIGEWRLERIDHPALHPGRSVRLVIGEDQELGMMGEVHPELAEQYDLPDRACLFDLRFNDLADISGEKEFAFRPLPRFPAVARDIAAIFSEEVPVREIEQTIREAGGALVEDVRLFDVYTGKSIPEASRSLAFSITLRAPERTLTDEEATDAMARVRTALAEKHGASFR